jgi:hypothetical protein
LGQLIKLAVCQRVQETEHLDGNHLAFSSSGFGPVPLHCFSGPSLLTFDRTAKPLQSFLVGATLPG